MSLLLIFTKLWRYKLVTFPIVGCILAGAFYVVAVTAPTYESSGTYILVNPPPLPTDAEIARNPVLGRIHDDNPYARFSDQSVLAQILASRLNSDNTRLSLAKRGADPSYTAAPSAEFGMSAPILQITGTGTSAASAVTTANIVGQALATELDKMQAVRGVDKGYRIKAEAVVAAHDARLKPSGKLRSLVAVFVLGTIVLFMAISILDAVSALRARSVRGRIDDDNRAEGGSTAPPPTLHRTSESFSTPDVDAPSWPLEAHR
jgi:capsular polysaccharide biosynthesis protein